MASSDSILVLEDIPHKVSFAHGGLLPVNQSAYQGYPDSLQKSSGVKNISAFLLSASRVKVQHVTISIVTIAKRLGKSRRCRNWALFRWRYNLGDMGFNQTV
jgi:hypothetical protein